MKLSFTIILETYKGLEVGKGEQGASPYCAFPISLPKGRSVLGSLPTFTNSTGVRVQTQRQPQGLQVSRQRITFIYLFFKAARIGFIYVAEAFPGKLAEIYSSCMVLLKVERRMVKKKLIFIKHLFCAKVLAFYMPQRMYSMTKNYEINYHFHSQVRLGCGCVTYLKSCS